MSFHMSSGRDRADSVQRKDADKVIKSEAQDPDSGDIILSSTPAMEKVYEGNYPTVSMKEALIKDSDFVASVSPVTPKNTKKANRSEPPGAPQKQRENQKNRNLVSWDKKNVRMMMLLNAERTLWLTFKDRVKVYKLLTRDVYGNLAQEPSPDATEQKFVKWRNQMMDQGELVPELIDKRGLTLQLAREQKEAEKAKAAGVVAYNTGGASGTSGGPASSGGRRGTSAKGRGGFLRGAFRALPRTQLPLTGGTGIGDDSDSEEDGNLPPSDTPIAGSPIRRRRPPKKDRKPKKNGRLSNGNGDSCTPPLKDLPESDSSDGEYGISAPKSKRKGLRKAARANRPNYLLPADDDDVFDSYDGRTYNVGCNGSSVFQKSLSQGSSQGSDTSVNNKTPKSLMVVLKIDFKKLYRREKRKREDSPETESYSSHAIASTESKEADLAPHSMENVHTGPPEYREPNEPEPTTMSTVLTCAAEYLVSTRMERSMSAVDAPTSAPVSMDKVNKEEDEPPKKTRRTQKIAPKPAPDSVGPIQADYIHQYSHFKTLTTNPVDSFRADAQYQPFHNSFSRSIVSEQELPSVLTPRTPSTSVTAETPLWSPVTMSQYGTPITAPAPTAMVPSNQSAVLEQQQTAAPGSIAHFMEYLGVQPSDPDAFERDMFMTDAGQDAFSGAGSSSYYRPNMGINPSALYPGNTSTYSAAGQQQRSASPAKGGQISLSGDPLPVLVDEAWAESGLEGEGWMQETGVDWGDFAAPMESAPEASEGALQWEPTHPVWPGSWE